MSIQAIITENPDGSGWDVLATDADRVHVYTHGDRITVTVHGDDDDNPPTTPLDVTLGNP